MVSRIQHAFGTPRGAMLALFLLALFNRLALVAAFPFDGLYGQDAYAYYAYARALFDALIHWQAPPPFFWPTGYAALLSVGFLFGGVNVAAAQMTTLVCGALVAPFAFALAYAAMEKNFDDALSRSAQNDKRVIAAWVAGLICVVCGQLAQSSVVIMTDAPALMFATLGAWLLLRYAGDWKSQQHERETSLRTFEVAPSIWKNAAKTVHAQHERETSLRTFGVAPSIWKNTAKTVHEQHERETSLRTLCLASLAVGLAVWMRWQNLIFAAAWFAALATVEWRAARISKSSVTRFCLAVGIVALVLSPQLWMRATTNAPLAGQSWLEGWSPANFFARTFDTVDGHFDFALPVAIFYGQVFAHPAYLFVMLTPLLVIGAAALVKRMNVLLYLNVLLWGWIFGMYFFLAGIPFENFRFPLGLFAPLAVVTGIGAGVVWERWGAKGRLKSLLLSGWIGVALVVMLLWQPRVLAPVLEAKAREMKHARFLETRLLPNAQLFTLNIDGAVREYTNLRVGTVWDMEPDKLNPATPTYLYADTNNIETQWRGKLPDQLVRGLKEKRFLRERDRFEGWTLWEIGD